MGNTAQKQEIKSIGVITINILENGGVNVDGNIKDAALNMQVIGKALVALGTFAANEAKRERTKRILTPTPGIILSRN